MRGDVGRAEGDPTMSRLDVEKVVMTDMVMLTLMMVIDPKMSRLDVEKVVICD